MRKEEEQEGGRAGTEVGERGVPHSCGPAWVEMFGGEREDILAATAHSDHASAEPGMSGTSPTMPGRRCGAVEVALGRTGGPLLCVSERAAP